MIDRLPCPITGCPHSHGGSGNHFSSKSTLLRHLCHHDHQPTFYLADHSICSTLHCWYLHLLPHLLPYTMTYSCTPHSTPTPHITSSPLPPLHHPISHPPPLHNNLTHHHSHANFPELKLHHLHHPHQHQTPSPPQPPMMTPPPLLHALMTS